MTMILMKSVLKDNTKLYPQLFLQEAPFDQ